MVWASEHSQRGVFGDPKARVISLGRRSKKRSAAAAGERTRVGTTAVCGGRDLGCGDARIYLEFEVRRVQCKSCGKVKREQLEFLADNPFYTQRFAHYVGRRCRSATVKDLAQELNLDWDTVKELDKQYMRAQLAKAVRPTNSTSCATWERPLDQVRQSEYARMTGKDRRFIKGQKYTLLWHRDNLTLEGRQALKTLLAANKQYEKFAEMIDRHWDGIATYCKPENKVSLGFVDGLNNTRSASSSRTA